MADHAELEQAQAAGTTAGTEARVEGHSGRLHQALRGQPLAQQEQILAPTPGRAPGDGGTPVAAEVYPSASPGGPVTGLATPTGAGKVPPPVPSRVGRLPVDQLRPPAFDPTKLVTPSPQGHGNGPGMVIPPMIKMPQQEPEFDPAKLVTPSPQGHGNGPGMVIPPMGKVPPPVPSRVGRLPLDQLRPPAFDPTKLVTPSPQGHGNGPGMVIPPMIKAPQQEPVFDPTKLVTPSPQGHGNGPGMVIPPIGKVPPPVPSRVGRLPLDQLRAPGFDPGKLVTPAPQAQNSGPGMTIPALDGPLADTARGKRETE